MPRFSHHSRRRRKQYIKSQHITQISRSRLRLDNIESMKLLPHPPDALPLANAKPHTQSPIHTCSRASQVQPRRHNGKRLACVFDALIRRSNLSRRWVSCGVAQMVIATKGPENEASHIYTHTHTDALQQCTQRNLPQASPPFVLWNKLSNGATCGSEKKSTETTRKENQVGRRVAGQWMTLKQSRSTGHPLTSQPRGPRVVCFVHHARNTFANTSTSAHQNLCFPKEAPAHFSRSGPLD